MIKSECESTGDQTLSQEMSNPHFPDDFTHENVRPTNVNTNTSNGPKSWTDQEDMALMYAWVNVSQNPIVDTNQKSQPFWKRIWEMFQESQALHPRLMGDERSIESLRNRHKRLNTNVTKWMVAYKEAYSRKISSMSDADVEKEAQKLYSSGKSTKFTHHEVFEKIMRHYPKWELKLGVECHTRVKYDDDADVEENHGSFKKSRTTGEEDDPSNSILETDASEASIIRRLADRDEAEAKRKEKVNVSQQSGIETDASEASIIRQQADRDEAEAKRKEKVNVSQQSVIPDEYTVELQAMRITREKEVEAINRMGNISLLNTLLGKSNLSPQEESLKNRLMIELFP